MHHGMFFFVRQLLLLFAFLFVLFAETTPPAFAEDFLTPRLFSALVAMENGKETPQQRALLFSNNDVINQARQNGFISNAQYQKAQTDYAYLNETFARVSAEEHDAVFSKQQSKPGAVYAPGTDSDYILKVKNADQIALIQKNYTQRVNAYMKSNGLDERDDWLSKLDVDYMADARNVNKEEFERIANLNNAAYTRREAAEFERKSRSNQISALTPEEFGAYGAEMRDQALHRTQEVEELRENPDLLKTDPRKAADFFTEMELEQKYIKRVDDANTYLRAQQGLGPQESASKPVYVVQQNANGENVLRRVFQDEAGNLVTRNNEIVGRVGQEKELVDFGQKRGPEQHLINAQANSVAGSQLNTGLQNYAESLMEAAVKNPNFAPTASRDIAAMTSQMSLADKGAIIEHIRQTHGNAAAIDVAEAMRTAAAPAGRLQRADNAIKSTLNTYVISDNLSEAGALRKSFNGQAAAALGALQAVGTAAAYYDTAMLAKRVIELTAQAIDPALSPEKRAAVQQELTTLFWQLAKSQAFSTVLAEMPMVAQFYGAWTLGYDGTTMFLQNTQTGQRFLAASIEYTDNNVKAAESFGADMTEYLGGQTDRSRQEDLYQSILAKIAKDIKDGKTRLREGKTAKDIGVSAVRAYETEKGF